MNEVFLCRAEVDDGENSMTAITETWADAISWAIGVVDELIAEGPGKHGLANLHEARETFESFRDERPRHQCEALIDGWIQIEPRGFWKPAPKAEEQTP